LRTAAAVAVMGAMAEQSGRQLSDYVALVRRRLWLILLVAAVTVAAAGVYTFNQPTVYESSMKIVVGQGGGIVPSQIGSSAQQLTQTLSELLTSSVVARTVIDRLHLAPMKPPDLLSRLSVVNKPDTSVLQVLYDDQNPEASTRILSEIGSVFTDLVATTLVPKGPDGKPLDPTTALSAKVFDPAHVLPGTVQPSPKRNIAVALAVGLMLGLLAALVREQFDDTLRTVPAAEEAFGQAATATLREELVGYRPIESRSRRAVDPAVAELAIERVRASIMWSPESREARTLLVTSSSPQDGKTTVAANLSVALAKEGHDVIVVDSDLRRPALHRYLSIRVGPETIGLDAVIRGEAPIARALIEVPFRGPSEAWAVPAPKTDGPIAARGNGRLRAILAAPGHTWPADLGIQRPVQVLQQLREMADYVVIDAAPILVVADAYAFVAAVDTVVAVVRVGRTAAAAVEGMSRTLERIRARRRVELVVTGAESTYGGEYYDYRPRTKVERREPTAPAAPVMVRSTTPSGRRGRR
jgi:receptor protein-tyrosine kinase